MEHFHALIAQVADILATGVMRLRMRNLRNLLNKNEKTEKRLEVSPGQSLYPVEPQRRRKK